MSQRRKTRRNGPSTRQAAGTRTAQTTRQVLATGSVAAVARYIPRAEADKPTLDTPQKVTTRFADEDVQRSIDFIKTTDVDAYIAQRYAGAKKKAGRPALVSALAILVAMHLAVSDNRPLLLTELRDILCRRINPSMRRLLDVELSDKAKPGAEKQWNDSTVRAVARAFHRLLNTIDPSTLPKNRVREWAEIEPLKKELSTQEQTERATALDWVCNQMLDAAYRHLPEPVRKRYTDEGPGYCIDATPMALFARGRGIHNTTASADPDGGYYVREADHRDPEDGGGGLFRRRNPKRLWAREIHLLALADSSHPTRSYMPAVPFAFTTDRPGVDPVGAARRIFANVANRKHEPGWLAGDILYTNQQPTEFQIPAREAGYKLVLGYGSKQLGRQGAHTSGMVMVEGAYYPPCMPEDLIEITALRRKKEISTSEYQALIRARAEYRMRNKETAKPGVSERLQCPAAGANPIAICELKPRSKEERPITQSDGLKIDLRRTIDHTKVLTNGAMPKVCASQTVTVAPGEGAKFRQDLQYGSPEQISRYTRLRQSQEGIHGTAKDEGGVALASPGRRRVRGWAAQQLFAAFLLTQTAVQRIAAFLSNAQRDENGHLYVPRPHARTGEQSLPPGDGFLDDAPSITDPPEDLV